MKLFLLILFVYEVKAQTIGIAGSVSLRGNISLNGISNPSIATVPTTSTQALLAYSAPSSLACVIKVSESAGLIPLVHDLNPILFTGADLDSRSTSANIGTARRVIVGSRLPAIANDGLIYSRALQTNTLHYYNITCGSTIINGTFTTANIPVGSTYNEPYQAHPTTSGAWLLPSITGIRNQLINDPLTGAQLSAVTIPTDHNLYSVGLHLGSGARVHVSNLGLHTNIDGNGNSGYLLNLDETMGYYGMFTHVPATGSSSALGKITVSPAVKIDDVLQAYAYIAPNTIQANYIGAYAPRNESLGQDAQFDAGTNYLTTAIPDLMHNFDSTFDTSLFGCEPIRVIPGQYVAFKCLRSSQDSYGWIGVFDPTTKTVIAAWNTFAAQPTKFCGIHEYVSLNDLLPNTNMAYVNFHDLVYGNTNLGTASFSTTLAADIIAGGNQITVIGNPISRATGGDSMPVPTVTVGDVIRINGSGSGADTFTITVKSGNVWTFTPTITNTVLAGGAVSMGCNAVFSLEGDWAIHYWRFLSDIHGTDTTGTYVIPDTHFPGGGHDDLNVKARVAEAEGGWEFYKITTTLLASLNQFGIIVPHQASFAGITVPGFGVMLTSHPSIQQTTTTDNWFLDYMGFNGGDQCFSPSGGRYYSACTGATLISGSLYEYHSDIDHPLRRKIFPTQASTGVLDHTSPNIGKNALRDISGLSSFIGTTSTYYYQYCVVYIAGECRVGSTSGQIFFNVPALTFPYCKSTSGPYPGDIDICILNTPMFSNTIPQIYMGTSGADSLAHSRVLTNGIAGIKDVVAFPLAKATPDAKYGFFTVGAGYANGPNVIPTDVWKIKIPPLPVPDNIDRTNFIPTPVSFDTIPTGTARVAVKFWYTEYGTNCGTRNERCFATGSTIPSGNDPYFYPSDNFTGLACSISCSISIPALSQRMLYYQKYYYDNSNVNIGTGSVEVIAIP